MNVLELGSGTGVLSITAAMMGAQVTSMELDPAANGLARQNFEVAGLPHRIISTDILNSQIDPSGMYSLIIANLPHKPVPSDGDLPLANDGGPHGTEVFEAVLPFLKSSLDRQGEFLFLQHSLPSPSFLITLQKDFELTLCAWRQRFINTNEFPELMPYWIDRHATGESYVSNINGKQALIFCAWRARRRTSHR
jgi:methylase of polypeptide subunit release factors